MKSGGKAFLADGRNTASESLGALPERASSNRHGPGPESWKQDVELDRRYGGG